MWADAAAAALLAIETTIWVSLIAAAIVPVLVCFAWTTK